MRICIVCTLGPRRLRRPALPTRKLTASERPGRTLALMETTGAPLHTASGATPFLYSIVLDRAHNCLVRVVCVWETLHRSSAFHLHLGGRPPCRCHFATAALELT
eukprot:6621701-Prymnesium_polylepis.1